MRSSLILIPSILSAVFLWGKFFQTALVFVAAARSERSPSGLIALALLIRVGSLSGQGPGMSGEVDFRQSADKLLQEALADQEFAGAAAGFSKDGVIRWENGAGYRDEENRQPFSPQTPTRIASITKPMTAVAIMQLYEQGKIDLDEPIRTYLPDFPQKKEGSITIRHLLQHSAGIGDYRSDKERENQTNYPTLADAVNLFKDRELVSVPGTAFFYSTYGYVLLGLVIERVSGMPYETYLKQNIWDKAGMTNTGVEYIGKDYPGKSLLYHKNDKGKIRQAKPTDLSDRVPGGGVFSCLTDMLKFGDAILNHTLIRPGTLDLMLADPGLKKQGNGYGLGWYLYGENPKYGNVFGHNGAQTGASTFLMLLPEQRTTIAVLSNTSGAMQRITNITIQLFDVAALAGQ